jgi:hypothetical protein
MKANPAIIDATMSDARSTRCIIVIIKRLHRDRSGQIFSGKILDASDAGWQALAGA